MRLPTPILIALSMSMSIGGTTNAQLRAAQRRTESVRARCQLGQAARWPQVGRDGRR